MANTYTNKRIGEDFEIYRGDEHVATYDPVTEDTTYTNSSDRFAGPIGRQVKAIARSYEPDEPPTPVVEIKEEPKVSESDLRELVTLRRQNGLLEKEVETLKRELHAPEERVGKVHPRYVGIEFGDPDAPNIDYTGDLTPEFVEWARYGGWSEADFIQVYTGRLKDLTYKG